MNYEVAVVVKEIINAHPSQAKAILARYSQVQERVREVFRTNGNLRALFPEYIEFIE